MHIFWGLFGITVSAVFVYYRFKILEITGPLRWAESYLGGSELGIVLIAILIFIWSLMYMTGMTAIFTESVFSKIF